MDHSKDNGPTETHHGDGRSLLTEVRVVAKVIVVGQSLDQRHELTGTTLHTDLRRRRRRLQLFYQRRSCQQQFIYLLLFIRLEK